jgi:hypothetical protein
MLSVDESPRLLRSGLDEKPEDLGWEKSTITTFWELQGTPPLWVDDSLRLLHGTSR